MLSVRPARGSIGIRRIVDVAVPALERVLCYGVPARLGIGDPQLPRLVDSHGILRGDGRHRNLFDLVRQWGTSARPSDEAHLPLDVRDDIILGNVEEPTRHHQGLAVGCVLELVAVCAEDGEHARLHRQGCRSVSLLLRHQGQLRGGGSCVHNHLQLGAPHHREELSGIFVLQVWGRVRIFVLRPLEGQGQHRVGAAVDVESKCFLSQGTNEHADRGDRILDDSQWRLLHEVRRVGAVHVNGERLAGPVPAKVAWLYL
mmetsp:Transcript_105532/g.235539  ORF Transcript_105532/g.235539 Transcript_105532/m.235539 type:complete len:258 (-) Transcript_105532:493-1266(-)